MNILILNWRDPKHPDAGGAEISTLEHAKGWLQSGHGVYWFSSYFENAKRKEELDGIKIVRKGKYYFGVQISAFFWYFLGRHPKFELVIDQFHGIPFFTPLYVRTRKLAFIHEVASEVWRLNPWPKPFNLIPAVIGSNFESFIFKFYKKVPFMTVSESTKKDLIKWKIPPSKIFVIQNGVRTADIPKKLDKEKQFTAIYLGALSKDKGVEDAIKIFAEIDRKDDQWRYWIVGRGSKEFANKLKNLSTQLGIREKIKFWGFVSDKKKFELLARAHILVNPSQHEGWGLVNIEANLVGTPVVGYKVGGLTDSVKDGSTGLLVEKGNYRQLAESALKLVRDKEKYSRFQKNCIKWASKFTWEKAREQSLELIESL